ncbi:MAG: septum site-determining protein Ssd [Nocardioidaceae bacterium]
MTSTEERGTRPLIMTTDEVLLDDLLRLSAAAGTTPEVARDVASARRAWSTAAAVVIGSDVVSLVADVRLPRRGGVVVACPRAADAAVWAHAVGVGAVDVLALPGQQATLIDLFGDCVDGAGRSAVNIGVVGGCGGSGSTSFAAGLGLTGAGRDLTTLLIDADPLGGGIDLAMGNEHMAGLRWPDLARSTGRLAAPTLREALPRSRELAVLSWDRGDLLCLPPESMRSVVSAGQRGHDLVVVDLPRRLDAAAEEAVIRTTVTLLVVPAQVRAVAAASRVVSAVRDVAPRLGLVVRTGGSAGLDAHQIEASLDLELWASMRPERGITAALQDGLGPLRRRRGALSSCCNLVLDAVQTESGAA